jgi:hypothetical protein
MTVVNDQHTIPGTAPDSDATGIAVAEAPGAGNLEKVRDILFGNQMREVDRRFARLEERIVKETRDLKDDIKRRLDALEAYATKETETLAGHIRQEHGDRVEANTRFARELADTAGAFERRTASLDEQLAKGQREIRQHILEQQQRLSEDMRERIDEVLAALARETHELRTDKTDRMALASLLKEMAMRLTDEFRLPDDEDRGNG